MFNLMKHQLSSGWSARIPTTTRQSDSGLLRELVNRLRPRRTASGLIRLGPDGDGGYLVPDDLAGIEACFSPGVSRISGFEQDCADRGMRVFLADRSVDGPAVAHPAFTFSKRFVGGFTDQDFMTLDHWVGTTLPDSQGDLMLQMDIEGYEYEVLFATSEALLRRFRVLVIEFHSLRYLRSNPFFSIVSRAIEKILQTHHCVHIHPNNASRVCRIGGLEVADVMEFTFIRKDRIGEHGWADEFPHPLDRDNCPTTPLVLPAAWYGQSSKRAA